MPEHNRNEALEFARRTRHNLEYVEAVAAQQTQGTRHVHVVTQLTLSLLGLVVFPREKLFLECAEKMTFERMASGGWPQWNISKDDCPGRPTTTLKALLDRLRNAICHARVVFDSDDRNISDVVITVEDGLPRKGHSQFRADWVATISAADLRAFCFRLLDFIEDSIG